MRKWMLVTSRRGAGAARAQLLHHYREEALPRLAAMPGLVRVVGHEAEPDDALLAAQQGRAPRPHAADAVTSLWCAADAGPAPWREVLEAAGAAAHALPVEEVVHWDYERTWPDGAASPGVKLLYFVCKRPDLTREAFVARYRDGHAPLARVHHPGIWRYAQSFVLEEPGAALRDAPDVRPRCDAIAELHFRTGQDLRERFYRDASSPAVIAEDVAQFLDLKRGFALVTRETIVKGGKVG